ncbi:hypothetical protein [Aeromonas phage Akh-2]|nr:hypothetical protein [Aeromonas phage Akh-2]
MRFSDLKAKTIEMDEFFLDMFVNGKKSFIQATVTPGKTEPQITEKLRKQLADALGGKPHVVVYDRTNERVFAVQPRFVSNIQPLNSVF